MGGMKSGTGDVWDDDDEEEEEDVEEEAAAETEGSNDEVGSGGGESGGERGAGGVSVASDSEQEKDIATNGLSDSSRTTGEFDSEAGGGSEQPYIVRRMLKDKSVQYERDERLTFFVHDDVKSGEQELEATMQDRFGRDIPVFDIREAVYRAALANREDVIAELEDMGYSRE